MRSLLLSAVLMLATAGTSLAAELTPRPNIVLIMADDK